LPKKEIKSETKEAEHVASAAMASSNHLSSSGQVIFCGGKWNNRSFNDIVNDPELGWVELQNYMSFLQKPSTARKEWIRHILTPWPGFRGAFDANHKASRDSRLDAIADKFSQDDFDFGYAGGSK
jgi:hypothetical protein